MQKGGVILISLFVIFFISIASPTLVRGIQGVDVGCQGVLSQLANRQAEFCTPGNANYNPYYCSCFEGSNGNGQEKKGITTQQALNQLSDDQNKAFGTSDQEGNYDFNSLPDSQKAKVEDWYDEANYYEKQAEQTGNTELSNGVEALKESLEQSGGEPPIYRAERISYPLVSGNEKKKGSYDAESAGPEISFNGYPNLQWLNTVEPFGPSMYLLHDASGEVQYVFPDETDSSGASVLIYPKTKKPIPAEGFGVYNGKSVKMPPILPNYDFSDNASIKTAEFDWGKIDYDNFSVHLLKDKLTPRITVNEDAVSGIKRVGITIEENGEPKDIIPMALDIQPKGAKGPISYTQKTVEKGMGIWLYVFLAMIIFAGVVITFTYMKEKKHPVEKTAAQIAAENSVEKSGLTAGIITLLGALFLFAIASKIIFSSVYFTAFWFIILFLGVVMIIFSVPWTGKRIGS